MSLENCGCDGCIEDTEATYLEKQCPKSFEEVFEILITCYIVVSN